MKNPGLGPATETANRSSRSLTATPSSCPAIHRAPVQPPDHHDRCVGVPGGRRRHAQSAAHRPEIRYVVLNVVEAAPVVNGILADQRRAMAAVQPLVTEPGRQPLLSYEFCLGPRRWQSRRRQISADACRATVGVAAAHPLRADLHRVAGQCLFIASPHSHRRMVLPAVAFPGQRPQDLQRLDALLAKPTAVQRHGAGCEVRIRQEGLHDTDGAQRQPGVNPPTAGSVGETVGRLGLCPSPTRRSRQCRM
jgi:hypothetical protein